MDEKHILVLDAGTTSTRAIVFTPNGVLLNSAQRDLTQYYPQAGWVEHDAEEIWQHTLYCAQEVMDKTGGASRIAAIGITNQRETVVAWDKQTGKPLARAIVWQDRRTAPMCDALRGAGHEALVRRKTGLLLDPYFSATKMRWLLDNSPEVAAAAQAGRLALGTVESWLTFKLTGQHLAETGNASRTLLFPLVGDDWDDELCALFGVPRATLGNVCESALQGPLTGVDLLGAAIPICGMAGDQQAATIGQGCLKPGETKATYGTGAFILTNMGDVPPSFDPADDSRLLGTVLCDVAGGRQYALEGSVFVAGSLIGWLRDSLGLIASANESEELARSVPNSGGVVVVPALSGLGAPHWRPEARGLISGLSFSTTRAHLARAALEAMAHQTHDLASAFAEGGAPWKHLRIDGGMTANNWMAQDIADLLQINVTRPDNVETTALGAAMLAACGAGLYPTLNAAAKAMIGPSHDFEPSMPGIIRQDRLDHWANALSAVL